MLCKVLISTAIPDTPDSVAKGLARAEYKRREVEEMRWKMMEMETALRDTEKITGPRDTLDNETQYEASEVFVESRQYIFFF